MKKKIIFIILLVILIAVLFLIPKDTYRKIFGKDDDIQANIEENNEKILVYMCDENNQLVGVNAYVNSLEEDLINQKFDILTKKTGTFKNTYDTSINTMTSLISYELNNNVLSLNVSKEFLESEGRKTIEQIVWTYCNDEINEVEVLVEGELINSINGFYFDNLSIDMGINLTCETNFIFEAKTTTVIEYVDDLIRPVTYVYKDLDECDFIVSKLFNEIYNNREYDYVISTDSIIIDLAVETSLSENLKKSIVETINYNMNISNIQVQGLNQVLLEITEENGL
ncbi:MAG: hypothetical protein E7183_03875 [Erysipelotrichaceae bacterium]|nr:hypothetical protein [Erysipelotrichaceae bacterium]